MPRQLTLFDALETLDTTPSARPGDWVKLRRKSKNAAYWKKGETVRVEVVMHSNGLILNQHKIPR